MRKNENTLKEVFRMMFNKGPFRDKYTQAMLKSLWYSEMGEYISKRTTKMMYSSGVLTIYIDSAPLRKELSVGRQKIKENLNDKAGSNLIDEIKFF